MCRVKRLRPPNCIHNSMVTKLGYALESPEKSLRNTDSKAAAECSTECRNTTLALGIDVFTKSTRAEATARFAPLISGEHLEASISTHQPTIKLGFFQFRTIPTSQLSMGESFLGFS